MLTCPNPEHQEAERICQERGKARFQLQARIKRTRVAHPEDGIAEDIPLDTLFEDKEHKEHFEVDEENDRVILTDTPPDIVLSATASESTSTPSMPSKDAPVIKRKKLSAQFHRQ
ncbi:hypothetical protein NLJ89_g8040 [Agrocybe chaxingu]|uniref:Uncharacterized protein n=1 Tax=Agrocybe chaxingu TaxID=84603 RepID=A0A9W8JY47_9AGAR|nr:hypothetical protein NLJ89_g8040 [Agrocybe chaxingu]